MFGRHDSLLLQVVELADAVQHTVVHREAVLQGRVTQLIGRRQRGVLQTSEQLVDFLLQTRAVVLTRTHRAGEQRVVVDGLDQGLCVLDEGTRFHLSLSSHGA